MPNMVAAAHIPTPTRTRVHQDNAAVKLAIPLMTLLGQLPSHVLFDRPNDGTDKTDFKVHSLAVG